MSWEESIMTLRRRELRIDVSDAVPFPGAELAVTLVVPDDAEDGPRTLAIGFPGAFYGRGYFDITHPGGYSQAEYHAERGWLFAGIDHLGAGDSSQPDPTTLTLEMLAAANDAASRSVIDALRAGTLVAGLGPIDIVRAIGMAQSTGCCVAIITQGRHGTFDALGVLGYSAVHAVIPSPTGPIEARAMERGRTDVSVSEYAESEVGSEAIIRMFHWEDVDPALRAADVGSGYPLRTKMPPWGSASAPPAFVAAMTPGVVAAEAAAIEVPVFIGVGDRDVCPDPRAESAAYRSVRDFTLAVVPHMAHMHNFASTRHRLWARLHAWGETLTSADIDVHCST
jgi:pimeloyl-ACP methyl ester carboxylesterase